MAGPITADQRGGTSVYATYRVAGAVLLSGAGLAALLPIVLSSGGPHGLESARQVLFVCCGIAAALGVLFLVARRPLPMWVLYTSPSFVTILICVPAAYAGAVTPAGTMLLIWPLLFTTYFLPEKVTWATLAVALGGSAVIARHVSTRDSANLWIEMASSLLLTTCFVLALRRKIDRLTEALRDQAAHDPLTGLANRRTFDGFLDLELARRERTGVHLSLLTIDVDHFKRVNDTSGHPAGDAVLRALAEVLTSRVRSGDLVARTGGEEFCIVFTACDSDQAAERGEELRKAVADESMAWPNPITVSIGVATVPGHAATASELLKASDSALYAAKRSGRDAVRTMSSAPHAPHR